MRNLSELQRHILDCMIDDAEDIEQVYLCANHAYFEKTNSLSPEFPLRDIIDEIRELINAGMIKPKYSNDEENAPLTEINQILIHHYWFYPTEAGMAAWRRQSESPDSGA